MKILLSNDDGYRAEGLQALKEAIEPLGAVTVVAPDRNQVPLPELLMHLGDRHPHQFGDPLQVINRLVGL